MPQSRGGPGGGTHSKAARSAGRKQALKPPPAAAAAKNSAPARAAGGNTPKDARAAVGRPTKPAADLHHHQKALSFAGQQRLLDVFCQALGPTLASPRLHDALQAVKRALFARDFAGAPPRALCYAAVLGSPLVQAHWRGADGATTAAPLLRMVALGGGAAEAVAFGAVLADNSNNDGNGDGNGDGDGDRNGDRNSNGNDATATRGHLVLVDAGPWATVVDKLCAAMVDAPPDGRQPALVRPAARLRTEVHQLDLLAVGETAMAQLLAGTTDDGTRAAAAGTTTTPTLVTLLFTLNELFTAGGLGAAATFLVRLTAASTPGTLLLVVDSPGSYAEAAVGTHARRYPMQWLLDKILLSETGDADDADDAGDAGDANGSPENSAAWTKLHQYDSAWFRLPPSLVYPIRLEDMRYQVHFYVRN
ncbi:hypothetical protein SPI_06312 [Niveomyces insectorum RCEF 264]|uniref:25S rRNA (Uridine(2843)-N(3))-methyltransferase n=1 Tax=Niveomyces insectorum RCEF 264 TaxID=1081102 RepID=A0A167S0G0_9HYPO|nr:hypothetical protein SPI_06312 [Niveomyces insectorum RCEF 264]